MAKNLVPLGSERQVNFSFQVNLGPVGGTSPPQGVDFDQDRPDVAALSDGRFVVVYESDRNTSPDSSSVFGHLFNADGSPAGSTFNPSVLANLDIASHQEPAVAARAGGGFVVVYQTGDPAGSNTDISLNVANSSGAFPNLTLTAADNSDILLNPDVATFADGRSIVVWQDKISVDNTNIGFRILNASGSAFEGVPGFVTNGVFGETQPSVATSGNLALVVYRDNNADGGHVGDIRASLYNATTATFTSTVTVAHHLNSLDETAVAALTGGQFVVVYDNNNPDNIFYKLYDPATNTVSQEFLVSPVGNQHHPRVASLPDGGFIITWTDSSETLPADADSSAIHARRYDASGAPAGDEFVVNTTTDGSQVNPSIAANATGNILVAWRDSSNLNPFSGDGDPDRIEGQVLQPATEAVNGTANADNITTYNLSEFISGLAGDDIVFAAGGNDTVTGGDGADVLFGQAGDDVIGGNAGNDVEHGGDDGNDSLFGDAGADVLFGGNGNDGLNGGDGNDTIVGNDGNDLIIGEAGNDIANGGNGDDNMVGGDGNDVLGGGASNDSVSGEAGDDFLFGEDGNDALSGGDGNDGIAGGGGDDLLDGGTGADTFIGGDGNDTINGGDGDDLGNGNAGNDTLNGGNGNDVLGGATGTDIVNGNAGNDLLFGEEENDTLNGGTGNDTLVGGANNDLFVFANGDGNDTIADFTAGGTDDVIQLVGTSLGSFAAVLAATTTVGGTAVITYNGSNTITLNGVLPGSLTAADFAFA